MHRLRERFSISPVEMPLMFRPLTQLPFLSFHQPLKPTHPSSLPPNHPPHGHFPADLVAACSAVTGPALPGELSFGEFPGGGGEGWRRRWCHGKHRDAHLHPTSLQTNHTLTCPRSAAPGVPSSGVTIPARPIEPPYGGFFGESGERWSRREHRRRRRGDNSNAALRRRLLAV